MNIFDRKKFIYLQICLFCWVNHGVVVNLLAYWWNHSFHAILPHLCNSVEYKLSSSKYMACLWTYQTSVSFSKVSTALMSGSQKSTVDSEASWSGQPLWWLELFQVHSWQACCSQVGPIRTCSHCRSASNWAFLWPIWALHAHWQPRLRSGRIFLFTPWWPRCWSFDRLRLEREVASNTANHCWNFAGSSRCCSGITSVRPLVRQDLDAARSGVTDCWYSSRSICDGDAVERSAGSAT